MKLRLVQNEPDPLLALNDKAIPVEERLLDLAAEMLRGSDRKYNTFQVSLLLIEAAGELSKRNHKRDKFFK